MKSRKPFLSVVIPAYNEEINLRRGVLGAVEEYLSKQKYSWEVIVVDDGSKDKTVELVSEFAKSHKSFRLKRENHRGKGGTVISGMLEAKGDIVLFTDMDQSTPIDQVEKFFPKFEQGSDIVIGSRDGREGAPIVRKMMAYGFIFLRSIVLRLPFKDTQCGFKAFKNEAARAVFKKLKVFGDKTKSEGASVTAGFDLEMLYIARKMGLKIAEVSVEWYEYGERKEVSPLKDSWEGLRDLIKIRINSLTGSYNSI